jgi:hypothetical protein
VIERDCVRVGRLDVRTLAPSHCAQRAPAPRVSSFGTTSIYVVRHTAAALQVDGCLAWLLIASKNLMLSPRLKSPLAVMTASDLTEREPVIRLLAGQMALLDVSIVGTATAWTRQLTA